MALSLTDLMISGQTTITEAEIQQYRSAGLWAGRTIRQVLTDTAAAHPEREALVGYRSDGRVERITYQQFDSRASRAAAALAHIGVRSGEAVAVMLPNWIEYGSLIFGINELGAIYVGIPVAYGERQVAAILRRSRATTIVVPRRWRSVEHLDLIRSLRPNLPDLRHVVLVDDDGADLTAGEVLWSDLSDAPPTATTVQPDDICYLGFTSGTTGEPKGAMHTHETLLHSAEQLAKHVGQDTFGEPMTQLVASPTGHHTGFIWGVVFTVCVAGTGVHVDRWEPTWGVDIIRRESITTFFGAPAFLQDMMRTDLAGDPDCPLRCVIVAGSSVPRSLPRQAAAALGAYIAPAWGMTECSIIISCTPSEPGDILDTDGSIFSGSQAKVIGPVHEDLPVGRTGELVVRGPSMFVGYFDRPDATADSFLPGNWFHTGDTASLDDHNWVTLRGRLKDIIIRGGENIPVTEIETLLFDHPDVVNAAVVGIPDERLGERVCAVVVLRPGQQLDLPSLSEYLLGRGLSKHYLPERLTIREALPMTQSGKIQKFALRDSLSEPAVLAQAQ